ncbi:MAG: lytic transglycosylase domain-containing protein [Thiohalophilus sp.]|uniref:lytic transglycosylase domain-containing protein n=1 Tax=Thiohalophilus sp. TaxID=3028392 RepID=UPI00286FD1FB|nr:lytic transglycosylase domain-containing protein [Thiohalophilus sp.]MDR9437752.1 lytic transglycosylase domain-containing protein [Thiohalophilus sp.]
MKPLAEHASFMIRAATLFFFIGLFAGPSLGADPDNVDPKLRQLLQEAVTDNHSFDDRFDAEVWLVDMSRRLESRVPDIRKRLNLLKQIHFEAKRAGLWPELVLAVIEVESNFNRFAISSAGAMGLMQVMPFWLDEIGQPGDNLFDIRTNLRMGCTILKYYLDKEDGNLTPALARYNGSYGSHRYTTKVYTALDNRWRRY